MVSCLILEQNHSFKPIVIKQKFFIETKELANIKKNEVVYDLYTGTGTIAQFVANSAKKVIGIDSVIEGIEAFINANKII